MTKYDNGRVSFPKIQNCKKSVSYRGYIPTPTDIYLQYHSKNCIFMTFDVAMTTADLCEIGHNGKCTRDEVFVL